MANVSKIFEQAKQLDTEQRLKLIDDLHRLDNDEWDKQIELDAQSGRLHEVFADDIAEFEAGKCRRI